MARRLSSSRAEILPPGDVRISPKHYNIYASSQVPTPSDVNSLTLRTIGKASLLVKNIGHAVDRGQLQIKIVHVDGQHAVYFTARMQGGNANTITIVNGFRAAVKHLLYILQRSKRALIRSARLLQEP